MLKFLAFYQNRPTSKEQDAAPGSEVEEEEEEGTDGGKPPGAGESPGQDTTSSERHSGGWEPGASTLKGASGTYRDNLIRWWG